MLPKARSGEGETIDRPVMRKNWSLGSRGVLEVQIGGRRVHGYRDKPKNAWGLC